MECLESECDAGSGGWLAPGDTVDAATLPSEFDLRPTGLGYTMRGWNFSRVELARAVNNHHLLNPALELGTNVCPWNCSFCFTEDPRNTAGNKRRLANEMSLDERLGLIDAVASLGTRSINIVGAGEPTIDPNFWHCLERMHKHGITPIVFTEGSLRLTRRSFVRRLYALGATVVLKVNSLWNEEYQNSVVRGNGDKVNPSVNNYTRVRNDALKLLIEEGFNRSEPTRLAFDTIICKQNAHEIIALHEYARAHNIFVLFVGYLPSGRSADGLHDALTRTEQFSIFEEIADIDRQKFGIIHRSIFPYAGGVPCSMRGTGLFVKITGQVFDCPGELITLGNVRSEPLSEIWERARPISQKFDGGCAPREAFWNGVSKLITIKPRMAISTSAL
jgi:MoaA/NifB/PqqE/SkfB family radical SAM enzyme